MNIYEVDLDLMMFFPLHYEPWIQTSRYEMVESR